MTKEEFFKLRKNWEVYGNATWNASFLALMEEVENAHPEWAERSVTLSRTDWVKLSAAWNYYINPPFSSVQDADLNRISTALREAKQ